MARGFSTWRLMRDAALIVALCMAGGGTYFYLREQTVEDRAERVTQASIGRMMAEISLRAATNGAETNEHGWPTTIDRVWFGAEDPVNALVDDRRAWLEIAKEEEANLQHPVMRVAYDDSYASFWYNPYLGIVRARVPVTLTDDEALAMYNRVNGCDLGSIFGDPGANVRSAEAGSMPRAYPESSFPRQRGSKDRGKESRDSASGSGRGR